MARTLAYNPALDGLRACAVAAVVTEHFSFGVVGFYGVSIFFVLSGYLITSLLLLEREQRGTIDLLGFYRRRFARLGPALVVVAVATAIFALAIGDAVRSWFAGLFGALTYSTDIVELTGWQSNVSKHFEWSWSLGVEEQFYLLWPALIIGLFALAAAHGIRRGRIYLAVACVALVALSWLLRWQMIASHAPAARINFSIESHLDALALGALLAMATLGRAVHRLIQGIVTVAAVVAAVLLVEAMKSAGPIVKGAIRIDAGGYGLVAIVSVVVVAGLVVAPGGPLARLFALRPLVHIGKLSYGIYLWNMLIKHIYVQLTGWNTGSHVWAELIAIAVLLVVCQVSYTYVETPLRRRWAHRQPPPEPEFTQLQPELANV